MSWSEQEPLEAVGEDRGLSYVLRKKNSPWGWGTGQPPFVSDGRGEQCDTPSVDCGVLL